MTGYYRGFEELILEKNLDFVGYSGLAQYAFL